ncbi:MAG: hypothetical protein AAF360_02125, partial [Pseudomonadota bacterium]
AKQETTQMRTIAFGTPRCVNEVNFDSVEEIAATVFRAPDTDTVLRLDDIVNVQRGYVDPASYPAFFIDEPAIVTFRLHHRRNQQHRLRRRVDRAAGGLGAGIPHRLRARLSFDKQLRDGTTQQSGHDQTERRRRHADLSRRREIGLRLDGRPSRDGRPNHGLRSATRR